jgi:Holliday junction DNA helicase RuvA
MYSDTRKISKIKNISPLSVPANFIDEEVFTIKDQNHHEILNDTLMACKELGFKEDKVVTIAQRILSANQISKAEQLIHLVLKEI